MLRVSTAMVALSCCIATSVWAQLRPLEPLDWNAVHAATALQLSARIGWFNGQRASLAGTKGDLIELGDVRATFRTGRVVIEIAGTPQRWFRDEAVFAAPTGGALPAPANGKRHDSGDYRVGAVVLLGSSTTWSGALRFGTRLPTTDNLVGLDRDQTDFFAVLGAEQRSGGWRLSGEAGVGVHGTRLSGYEQSDVLLYTARVERRVRRLTPSIAVVGQEDLKSRRIRGNEDLGEVRVGLRLGSTRWVEATAVRGFRDFSPQAGLMLGGGWHFDWR